MKTHDLVGSTNKFTTNKDGRNGRVATEPQESMFDFVSSRDLIELVNRGVDPEVVEKGFDGMGHATRSLAEDHHRLLGCQLCHSLHLTMRKTMPKD
ncbi:hypothetical protein GQ457_09G023450 [Hibiscus cannabinus]